ncbi:hypothetical protein [Phytomonospora endophytica]|uniref:Uncharacterized protein n=1 Tax=Phytomonospora endophytica TaxID=714109 RepID=A0A841G593_9ACTN|nr:hypothetical protein [Phytomonospora endophytica]MBB6039270.1 hypothetical protein [Phytomonospora endophytica]GIG69788.1 hypothetical protein Pen01_60830 [Phytomonospora endophytica]
MSSTPKGAAKSHVAVRREKLPAGAKALWASRLGALKALLES